ncbi:hypothetical protein [Metabacillus sp. FJAT-53654]|uniref:XRE family transcriptional regulator n=1 Tax=Metabacillus rhizosphaerae TaxID=3117747 RepID=A0ABZ2MNK6_9BACI
MFEKKILSELQEYIELNTVVLAFLSSKPIIIEDVKQNALEEFITIHREPSFAQVLFSFVDKKGCSDSDIYKKAGIDRRHFSKIRSKSDYRPGKPTVIALALALELNEEETDQLLGSAGFSLSNSDTFDLVILFCLEKRIYDLDEVNQALEYLHLKPLIK